MHESMRPHLNVLRRLAHPPLPALCVHAGKIAAVSRLCLARRLAMVVVGFPATSLLLTRARVCISAAHTRADLDYALSVIWVRGCSHWSGLRRAHRGKLTSVGWGIWEHASECSTHRAAQSTSGQAPRSRCCLPGCDRAVPVQQGA